MEVLSISFSHLLAFLCEKEQPWLTQLLDIKKFQASKIKFKEGWVIWYYQLS